MAAEPGTGFDHVLLTRFSAVLAPGAPPAQEEWLRYRLAFFYDACLPSVLSQRGAAPVHWLVLLDDRCPDDFRADVEQLAAGAFTPLWTHEPFRRDSFAAPVASRCAAPYLITTRLDSDDALAVDHLAAVQAQFARQDRMFVNFPRGVQIDRSGAVYRSNIVASPFLSFIERRRPDRPPQTVYVAKHARARGHAPLRQVRAPVMWAQVVHGSNVSNIVNGTRVDPRVVQERFDISLGYDADLSGVGLLRARAAQLGRLGRLWTRHPGELTKWVEAEAVTARGTRVWPQDSGDGLSDRVQRSTRETRARLRDRRFALKERVNARVRPGLRVLAGDPADVLSADRAVVLVEWSPGSRVRPSALRTAQAFAAAGWPTLVVAARDPWVHLRRPDLPPGVVLARRPNSAYDFGSWRDALAAFPQLAAKERLVLMNDSLEGPAGPVEELLRRIEDSPAQVWGATESPLPRWHLASYLLAFADGVLARPPLQDFFASVVPQPSKRSVIRSYELGLGAVVQEAGLDVGVGWAAQELGLPADVSVPLAGWRELLDAGFPFVKRTLLVQPRFASWRPEIEARLAAYRDDEVG